MVFSNFVGPPRLNQVRWISIFFLLDNDGQTQVYRLVSGQTDVQLLRNGGFPTEGDNLPPCYLGLNINVHTILFFYFIKHSTLVVVRTCSLTQPWHRQVTWKNSRKI